MIKTTYQTPELRDSNDNIVQEGAFGKNTALSNSDNTGWIDYVVNNLEAIHDTIGDSAATLDGNGHVVEPANLAIGDEDGNRLKTSYLKLTGGTVSGKLNVAQNLKFQDNQENVFGGVYVPASSATSQYAQFYGGESVSVAGAKLTLYPDGDGRFKLDARSTDGANTYTLVTDNNGNLNWRGYPLAWKKDYLPLTGGTLTGNISLNPDTSNGNGGIIARYGSGLRLSSEAFGSGSSGALIDLSGRHASSDAGVFRIYANSEAAQYQLVGSPSGTLKWGGKNIERVNASGTNYIRYENGIQICWRSGAPFDTNDTPITLPVPFKDATYAVSAIGKGLSTSTNVAIPKIVGKTTTDFTIKGTSTNGITTFTSGTVDYVAIGWWK